MRAVQTQKRVTAKERAEVTERAANRCEYCLSPARFATQPFSVEHIHPRQKGGDNSLENLAFACQGCNGSKYTKITGLDPFTKENVPLYHPRQHRWSDHFAWSEDFTRVLGLTPTGRATIHVLYSVIKSMVPLPETARMHLRYAPQGGPTLTGNADGLRYLSDLCAALADAPMPGSEAAVEEHVHLYENEAPLFGQSYGLTIYHSLDDWFDRHAAVQDDADTDEAKAPLACPPREIMPEQIAAVEFFQSDDIPLPPALYLRYDKLYCVIKCRPHSPEDDVWERVPPGEEANRMYVFTIRDDAQEIFDIALDLDDVGIHYFTASDLEQIWEAGRS